jgi:hypothetical protein
MLTPARSAMWLVVRVDAVGLEKLKGRVQDRVDRRLGARPGAAFCVVFQSLAVLGVPLPARREGE